MYDMLERLLKRQEERDFFDPANKIVIDEGEKCWAAQCLFSEGAGEAPKHHPLIAHLEQTAGVPAESADEMHAARLGEEYVQRLRLWLGTELAESLDSVDDKKNDWRRKDKLARIGFPMHLRIVRDTTEGVTRSTGWNPDGLRLAKAWGIDSSEAAWLWRHLFAPQLVKTDGKASTRIMAVAEDDSPSRGAQGFSNVLTVATISWTDDERPEHGFVPHPESFGYCLDDEFRGALFKCHQYLKHIGLWSDGIAVEWNLEMKRRTPVLTGGSAGAAFALVAGSLLARLQLRERQPA
jgi:hypothetical protein